MFKRTLIFVLVLLLALIAAPTFAQQGEVSLPEDCAAVSLEYWNPFTGPDGPFMGQIVDAFNAEHENIQVAMTTQSEYYTQLGTAARFRYASGCCDCPRRSNRDSGLP